MLTILCGVHELNRNNVETLHLIGRLISENTRALIKKQKLCHTLLHRDGEGDWTQLCACACARVCVYICVSHIGFYVCVRVCVCYLDVFG